MLLQQRKNTLQTANKFKTDRREERNQTAGEESKKVKAKMYGVGRHVKYPCLEEVTFTRISRADKSWEMYKKMGFFKGKQNHFGRISSCDHI